MKSIELSALLPTYAAWAPDVWPINSSPIIKSSVFEVGPSNDPTVIFGDVGVSVPFASKIP